MNKRCSSSGPPAVLGYLYPLHYLILLFVGFTAEFYYSGFIIIWLIGAYYVGGLFAALIMIPKFFRLGFKITSAYEYFYHRFSLPVRLLVSVLYFLFTVGVLFTIFGSKYLLEYLSRRLRLFPVYGICNTSTEPWDRYNVWSIIFLWGLLMMGLDGADQMILQRYMTVSNLRLSQRTILLATTIGALFLVQTAILGMIMPHFLMKSLGGYHGIPGIVVASLFAASLSSLSSGQNALAAVFLEDIVRPIYKLRKGRELSKMKISLTSRILGKLKMNQVCT
ncbi:hypothetical protein LSH36_342g07036 [Paralvinella palmiformis]|uniref:Uncharacterized protein n=1 Tax=Paralvinella palmiformis TaxID=53620 RepID=A0AAD9N1W7_9ANNE|nr:hypothetical protein LSH36_342g07036 [Paralvinella palmiformis]